MFFFVKVNQKFINIFYTSLNIMVKLVNEKMKSGTLKMIYFTNSLFLGYINHDTI